MIKFIFFLIVLLTLSACTNIDIDKNYNNSDLKINDSNTTVKGLENFYMINFLEPIFFTPEDYPGQINLSNFYDFTNHELFLNYLQ